MKNRWGLFKEERRTLGVLGPLDSRQVAETKVPDQKGAKGPRRNSSFANRGFSSYGFAVGMMLASPFDTRERLNPFLHFPEFLDFSHFSGFHHVSGK